MKPAAGEIEMESTELRGNRKRKKHFLYLDKQKQITTRNAMLQAQDA